ncbi:MAG: hypothetical protein IJW55_04180 [Clostridia bacterium]|nr:hypothetical protein [Clostridia bacterium]
MNIKLAEIAREEARKNYHGDTVAAIGNLQPLAELFEAADDVTLESLNTDWSGAFAFLCTEAAGLGMPVRYPDPRVCGSFAYVQAWEQYARLPKIRLWFSPADGPEVGDLVIFEPTEQGVTQMGVVLSVTEESMDVAIGNYHNHSAVVERPLFQNIRGYVRLEE